MSSESRGIMNLPAEQPAPGHLVHLEPERMRRMVLDQIADSGDLSRLDNDTRADLLMGICQSLGFNPMTRPLEYTNLDGKLVLYARKDATDQLRKIHHVSVRVTRREELPGDLYAVTAVASMPDGRSDESVGVLSLRYALKGDWKTSAKGKRYRPDILDENGEPVTKRMEGEALANALMKCETKAKRRVTLSICGLGFLDETEIPEQRQGVAVPAESVSLGMEPPDPAELIVLIESAASIPELWGIATRAKADGTLARLSVEDQRRVLGAKEARDKAIRDEVAAKAAAYANAVGDGAMGDVIDAWRREYPEGNLWKRAQKITRFPIEDLNGLLALSREDQLAVLIGLAVALRNHDWMEVGDFVDCEVLE